MRFFPILIIIVHCISISSFAQPMYDAKRDYMWVLGHESGTTDSVSYVYFNFQSDTLVLSGVRAKSHDLFQTNASICDTAGNLLLFSNGCVLLDSAYQLIQGADTINRGVRWNNYCNKGSEMTFGYVVNNGCWILPLAKDIFRAFYVDLINAYAHTSGIRSANIDINETGQLIGRNPDTYLFQADLHGDKRAFVRHANGLDWWQVNEAYSEHRYYISFIDSSNQIKPTKQQIFSIPIPEVYHGGGQACFSPDGTKYMTIDAYNQCQVFDFDRCKGELSNMRHIALPVPYDSVGASTGIAVSPNSRFMYLMTLTTIWQYDLNVPDIEASKIKVAQHDGFRVFIDLDTFSFLDYRAVFYQSQLGPDGKIYVFPTAGRRTFTVIENPNVQGLGCNVIQHKYITPLYGAVSQPPRFPNFRLGPEVGSPCDTIKTSSVVGMEEMQSSMLLRPNPATTHAVADITLPQYDAEMQVMLVVTDLTGNVLAQYQVPPYAALQRIETSHLPNGMYLVALKSKGRVLRTEKLVVLRE